MLSHLNVWYEQGSGILMLLRNGDAIALLSPSMVYFTYVESI